MNNSSLKLTDETQINYILEAIGLFLKIIPNDKLILRLFIIFLRNFGVSQVKVAELTGLSTRQIRNIEKQFDGSSDSLLIKPKSGRTKKKNDNLVGKIVLIIDEFKYKGIKVTFQAISNALLENYGIKLCRESVRQIVNEHDLGSFITNEYTDDVDTEDEKKCLGYTRFGGGFLLIPQMIILILKLNLKKIDEVILTIIGSCIAGIKRSFHFQDELDIGIALFTGRTKLMDGTTLLRKLKLFSKDLIEAIYLTTLPTGLDLDTMWVAIDEHVIPRWTKKYKLWKTKHSTRNRVMKGDKLLYAYEIFQEKIIGLEVMKRAGGLTSSIIPFVKQLQKNYNATVIRIIVDAGAYKGTVFARLNNMPGVIYLIRAKGYKNSVIQWATVKLENCKDYIRPHERGEDFKGKPKVYKIFEFYTKIGGCAKPIRTVLIINPSIKKKTSKRFFALFTNDLVTPIEILADQYMLRWRLENLFKVKKWDLNLDVLPKSYSLNTKNIDNPNFLYKYVMLVAWIKSVVFNTIVDFKKELPEEYRNKTVGTIIRKFILKPATIYIKNDIIEINLHYFKDIEALKDYCEKINNDQIRVPWIKNRILKITLQLEPEMDQKKMRKLVFC